MFSSVSRGIPSFGDLASKQPVAFATDVSLTWTFPVPTLSPVGAPAPGQTLTKNGNGALSAEPPMAGTVMVVGDRLLVTADNPGIWVVTALGSGVASWVLTRATDADTTAELLAGATTTTSDFALDGGLFNGALAFFGYDGATWNIMPNVIRSLAVLNDAVFNVLGALDPAVDINGRLVTDTLDVQGPARADSLALDNTNRDVRLRRSAAKTATWDDGAGGPLTEFGIVGKQLVVDGSAVAANAQLWLHSNTGRRATLLLDVTGDAVPRFRASGDATVAGIEAGDGANATDVQIRRLEADLWRTEDSVSIGDRLVLTGWNSTITITANTDNWNPAGLVTLGALRIASDAARNLTGIVAPTANFEGSAILLCNVGGFTITLVHDATSTAANRFLCPGSANFALTANRSVWLWYDPSSNRWRVVG